MVSRSQPHSKCGLPRSASVLACSEQARTLALRGSTAGGFEWLGALARRHEACAVVRCSAGKEIAFGAGILLVAGPARAKDAMAGAAPRTALMPIDVTRHRFLEPGRRNLFRAVPHFLCPRGR